MDKYKILIVEDDAEISSGIKIYLLNQGYDVFQAYNGQEGLDIMAKEEIHLALVDIMMPVMDGITMVMKAKEKYDFPIVMLTAKSEDMDIILGLHTGADDYITKPFAPLELLARVQSHLRRYQKYLNLKESTIQSTDTYVVGGIELNSQTKEVYLDGNLIKLTPIEFKILELFMKNPGRVYSGDTIYELVWNEQAINSDTVMVHIRNLREKIEIDPKNPRYIKVVWGVGYKIEKM